MSLASDYATMPESEVAEGKKERRAELVLAKLAEPLVMSGRLSFLLVTVIFLGSLVWTGLWLRTLHVPHGWETAAAWETLAAVALAAPVIKARAGKKEPAWARSAAVHEQSVWGRIPTDMCSMLHSFTASMRAGIRWRSAHVYVAQCTHEAADEPHYDTCCAGGTLVMNGRLLVILGEHLAMGPTTTARAALEHERRHIGGWRPYAYALASVLGTFGLVIVGWSVRPWPQMLLAVVCLRVLQTSAIWMIEISCDVEGAWETSPAAMLDAVDFKQRTAGSTRALEPLGKRWAYNVLTWLAGAEHPPYSMRKAMITACTQPGPVE
jgi:hypothetical protein